MAINFKNTKGKAEKTAHEAYKYKDNENVVRLVGDVLPRYVYWIKGTNNKDIPIECLAFDRAAEAFTRAEKDHVTDFHPTLKCSWAYVMNCIDLEDGKVKVLNLKKKLFQQIMDAAEDLGDPTDPDNGWNIVFKKIKTGPNVFNVEYNLSLLRCKKSALTAEQREAVAASKTIDEKFPRPTPDNVLATLTKLASGDSSTDGAAEEGGTDGEAIDELSN